MKLRAVFASLIALLFVVTACTPSGPTSAAPTELPTDTTATLRIAVARLPRSLDSNSESTTASVGGVFSLLYNRLVQVDENGQIQPSLATSWRVVDPETWEFKLRQGVKFHNGETFAADSVRATILYMQDPNTKATPIRIQPVVREIKVVDPQTVQIMTKGPFPVMTRVLASISMLPPKYLAESGAAKFGLAPVGTGPFKLVEFRPDGVARLARFDDYWGGKPQVAAIDFRQLPETSARVAALRTNEADISFEMPLDQLESIKTDGYQVISKIAGTSWAVGMRDSVKPLDDPRVRLALTHATDANAINKALFGGLGRILNGQFVGQNAIGYNPELKPHEFDQAKARKLLADAGHPNGFTVRYESPSGRWFNDKQLSEAICAQWAQVNVKCDLQLLESSVWQSRFQGATVGPITIAPWGVAPELDLGLPLALYTPSSTRKLGSNPKIEPLFQRQLVEVDEQKRAQILKDIAKIFHEEPPAIFLFENVVVLAAASNVKGIALSPMDQSLDALKIAVGKK